MSECPTCGQEIPPKAMAVSIHGMYDIQLFTRFVGATPKAIVKAWKNHNATPNPAIVGGRKVDDLGPASLCPAIVLTETGKELRRVGTMVHSGSSRMKNQLREWLAAVEADPDIPRILADTHGEKPNE